jgi:hypothetical protein
MLGFRLTCQLHSYLQAGIGKIDMSNIFMASAMKSLQVWIPKTGKEKQPGTKVGRQKMMSTLRAGPWNFFFLICGLILDM